MTDWMQVLRDECARASQRAVADRIGVSQSTINQVLRGTYKGRLFRIEERVRGELMHKTLECPVLGEISRRRCQDEQQRGFSASSPQRVQLYTTCPHCRHGGARRLS